MIRQCDPTLCDSYAAIPEEVEPEDIPAYRERRRERAVNVLVHEIGHCLGPRTLGGPFNYLSQRA